MHNISYKHIECLIDSWSLSCLFSIRCKEEGWSCDLCKKEIALDPLWNVRFAEKEFFSLCSDGMCRKFLRYMTNSTFGLFQSFSYFFSFGPFKTFQGYDICDDSGFFFSFGHYKILRKIYHGSRFFYSFGHYKIFCEIYHDSILLHYFPNSFKVCAWHISLS